MRKHLIPPTHGGSHQKIVVCTNSLVSAQQAAYTNHCQMWFRFGRDYRQFDFCFSNPPRMSIDRAKNVAAELALDIEAKYLLIIDDDVLMPLPFDFLDKLIACKSPIAAADVLVRGYPFQHMMFKYTDRTKTGLKLVDNIPKQYKGKHFPVDAVGFSCCLIEVDFLRQLEKPYFLTGVNCTEDVYFCVKARYKDPDCKITVDASIECGHILWNEIISSSNKPAYKKYHETLYGKPQKESPDRGKLYLDNVKRHLHVT